MKKSLTTFAFLMLLVMTTLVAQEQPGRNRPHHGHDDNGRPVRIENMIPDLTTTQKTRLEIITQRSSKSIKEQRNKLNVIRDSIRMYMDDSIDRREILFPLFEREARIQANISKTYYESKRSMDSVLTPEQYVRLRQKMLNSRHHPEDGKQKVKK